MKKKDTKKKMDSRDRRVTLSPAAYDLVMRLGKKGKLAPADAIDELLGIAVPKAPEKRTEEIRARVGKRLRSLVSSLAKARKVPISEVVVMALERGASQMLEVKDGGQ